MTVAERLCGAVIAGLMVAVLLPQVEALSASPDVAKGIDQVEALVSGEMEVLAHSGERLLEDWAHEAHEQRQRLG